jgi:hypothetical protein
MVLQSLVMALIHESEGKANGASEPSLDVPSVCVRFTLARLKFD